MNYFKTNELTASFYYNNEKKYITAGTHTFEKGLEVTLEHEKVCDCADKLLLRMKNISSEDTYQINKIKTLDLTVKTDEKVLYHGLEGDDCGETSFLPKDFTVENDYHEEPKLGRSSDTTGFPYFDLTWGNESAVFGIGWTGQWCKDISLTVDGFNIQLGLAEPDLYLEPGEEVRMASVLVVKGEKVSETRKTFRNILREHYSPKTYLGDKMYLPTAIQCFDRYFQGLENTPIDPEWNTVSGQIRTADAALKMKHIDTLWLDAAWFKGCFPDGVGNYSYHEGFPNGLKNVSDYLHKKGMKFVLWFEPERIKIGSELYEDEEKLLIYHPTKSSTRLFNLADEKARAWLKNKLISIIRDNGVDVYRQDFNHDPLLTWQANDPEGRKGITELKYVAGMYDLWDSIRKEFPEILIDNCSSGGRRLDFETTQRSVTLWKSDTGCFPDNENRAVTMWSQNQTLTLCEYLPYLACAVWTIDPYTVRSTATQGIACNFDIFNPDFDFKSAENILAEVQEFKDYWNGDFYPLTEAKVDESVWAMYQLARKTDGIVYAFRRAHSETSAQKLNIQAIDEAKAYKLTFIDEKLIRTSKTYSGKELSEGIEITIPNKRESLIVKYEEV